MTENRISLIAEKTFDDFVGEINEIFEMTSDSCLAYKIGGLHERMRNVLQSELMKLAKEMEGD